VSKVWEEAMKEIPGYRNLSPFIVPQPCTRAGCTRDGIYFRHDEVLKWKTPMFCEFHARALAIDEEVEECLDTVDSEKE